MLPEDKQKLDQIEKGSDQIIYRATSVFPFDLFPNSIIVDKNKIDIVYRYFFWTKNIFSIMLLDLTNIRLTTGPFFATVYFEVRGYETNPPQIEYLKKHDAIELREIVIGLTKATHERISIDNITTSRIRKLKRIGNTGERLTAAI